MVLPFSRALLLSTSVAALCASGLSAYAIGGNDPEFVADFAGVLNSGTEYYRSGGSDTTFSSVFTHSGLVAPATMVDSDGVLKWAPHNYSPRSQDFTQWTTRDNILSITGDVTSDPDGGSNGDEVIESTATGVHRFRRGGDVPDEAGSTRIITFRVWCKAASGTRYPVLSVFGVASVYASCAWNLSGSSTPTQQLTTGGLAITAASKADAGNGWYLLSMSVSGLTSTGFGYIYCIGMSDATTFSNSDRGFPSYTGDGTSGLYFYGAHIYRSDLGGMVNNPDRGDSYVPTTTAARFLPRRNHYIYNGTSWENAGILIEPAAATNLALNCRSPLSWSVDFFVNDTDSATTGIDGVSNSAGTITAAQTGGCFIGQDITVSNTIVSSVYLKRLSGTGVVALTQGEAVGSELVTNGTFDSDVSGWTAQANTTLAWNASGAMDVTSTSSISGAYTSFATVSGKVYKLTVGSISGGAPYLRIGTTAGGSDVGNANGISNSNNPYYFIAKSSTTYLTLSAFSGSTTVTFDDVSVTEVASAALTEATAWERLITPAASLTNPRVCIVFAENTDSVGVDFLQVEVGSVATSPILTTGSTVTRASETLTVAGSSLPANTTGMSFHMRGRMTYADVGATNDFEPFSWRATAGVDEIYARLVTQTTRTGMLRFQYEGNNGGGALVDTSQTYFSPGLNVPYNFATYVATNSINMATDGTALTENTTSEDVPNLSSTALGIVVAGTASVSVNVGLFRMWGVKIGDSGIETAST